jgi:predicted Fe-Mo cluster-binding NifX family protein
MKIAISAKGQGLDAVLDPRFGRSPYFVIVDTTAGTIETLTNANATASGGAGIQTAQFISKQGVELVITGSVGPKATQVLAQAGIEINHTKANTVSEAIKELDSPNGDEEFQPTITSSPQNAIKPTGSYSKLAIATDANLVAPHFGHCPTFTILTVSDNQVKAKKSIPNPGHKPGFLPRYLADLGIDCIITGGIGGNAEALFAERGIRVIGGVQGPVDDVVAAHLAGRLQPGESLCDHDI